MMFSIILCMLLFLFITNASFAAPFREDDILVDSADNETNIPKIPKCCPLDEALLKPSDGCSPSKLKFIPPFEDENPEQVDLIIGFKCDHGKYRLEPNLTSEDEFHLLADGSLLVPFHDVTVLSPLDYCLDNTLVDDVPHVLPFLCFPPPVDTKQTWRKFSHIIFPIGCLISIPFLVIVVLMYTGISELRTTHGKVLSCHSACLAIAYLFLSIVQIIGDKLTHPLCVTIAFIIQFSFMACFFWLNLLCLHTWRQLNIRGAKTNKDKCLFNLYSIYGWGVPIVIISVSIIMDFAPAIPSSYLKPNFGVNSCWFQSDSAALPYFYGPIAVLLILNTILFVMSTRLLHRKGHAIVDKISTMEQAAISVLVQKRKQSFLQAVILFLAMGLNWFLEVISWAVGGPPSIWIVTDIFNTLQGIIIFYIFVARDDWVRSLGIQYFKRICCCSSDSIGPSEEHTFSPINEHNGHNFDTTANGKKHSFQKMIPLVLLKNKGNTTTEAM